MQFVHPRSEFTAFTRNVRDATTPTNSDLYIALHPSASTARLFSPANSLDPQRMFAQRTYCLVAFSLCSYRGSFIKTLFASASALSLSLSLSLFLSPQETVVDASFGRSARPNFFHRKPPPRQSPRWPRVFTGFLEQTNPCSVFLFSPSFFLFFFLWTASARNSEFGNKPSVRLDPLSRV